MKFVKNIITCFKLFTFLFLLILSTSYGQEGIVKSFYPNGNIKSAITFSDSIREGEAKFYYTNGNLKEERTYVNGSADGIVTTYYPNGKPKEIKFLQNGIREGVTSFYDSSGSLVKEFTYKNGKLFTPGESHYSSTPLESEKPAADKSANEAKIKEESEKLKKADSNLPPEIEEDNYADDPAFYLSPEVMPVPVDGEGAIQKKVFYPPRAKENGIEGVVKIRAFIERNGDVLSTEILKGIGYGCEESAEIAVYYTKFKPGLIKGQPVRTQIVIPIEFKIEETQ